MLLESGACLARAPSGPAEFAERLGHLAVRFPYLCFVLKVFSSIDVLVIRCSDQIGSGIGQILNFHGPHDPFC